MQSRNGSMMLKYAIASGKMIDDLYKIRFMLFLLLTAVYYSIAFL